VLDHIRVARKRVLRLMRENGLLSPHRHLPRQGEAHDGHITTDAPNLMCGTDATQIPTVLDGKVWLFAVVDHWNAEAMGWHVAKIGNRYAAAQAVGMAIKTAFNAVAAGIARGLALRHDHGSAFMADHFQNQIKFWGMAPSFAFVGEPETNGVAERFFPEPSRNRSSTAASTRPSTTSALLCGSSSNSTMPSGSLRKTGYAARAKRVSPGRKPT
jgi:putative transposase